MRGEARRPIVPATGLVTENRLGHPPEASEKRNKDGGTERRQTDRQTVNSYLFIHCSMISSDVLPPPSERTSVVLLPDANHLTRDYRSGHPRLPLRRKEKQASKQSSKHSRAPGKKKP
jgi:hypothetical protein